MNNGLTDLNVSSMTAGSNTVYAGTDGKVFYSTDNGDNWQEYGNQLLNLPVQSLIVYDVYVYAGIRLSSVWKAFGITPVELTSFSAVVSDNTVVLNWRTATETNNKGFEIERMKETENGQEGLE